MTVDFTLLSGASMIALGFAAFGIDESVSVSCTTPSSSVHESMGWAIALEAINTIGRTRMNAPLTKRRLEASLQVVENSCAIEPFTSPRVSVGAPTAFIAEMMTFAG
jgi:hypothetical protein